ncbi:MAG: FAD-binding oxidoreductase [Deltaproteobacteria bacterium]|nr:FAD-binding oxidoreductase [Deltaproteobacteria bacterium]
MGGLSDVERAKMVDVLEDIVSKEYVSTNLFERIKNTVDVYPYEVERGQICYAVVMPKSKGEISEIMKYANSIRVPVFIRGSATHLGGNYRPHVPGIVVSTHRLDKLEVFEDYGFFECEPGCIVANVADRLAELGYFLPMAPGSRQIATMGGMIVNNTSGHIVGASIGKPGDYVLGLEVVLPNGDIIETGTKGLRRPAGTDLTKFFLGGDGLLGVITKIRMRLVPQVERAYGVAIYDDLFSLARGVQRMYMERRPAPLFMEFLDAEAANFGFGLRGLGPPGGPVNIFVSIGSSEREVADKADKVLESLKVENPIDAYRVEDIDVWHKIWASREAIGSNLMQRKGAQLSSAEVSSNLKDLVNCMEDCINFNKGLPLLSQLDMFLFGHIGALTLHPAILIPRDWDDEQKRKAIDEKFQREAELNLKYGTCGGEWGQFGKRKDFFIKRYGERGYEIVKGLKKMIDPNNILNPGILEGYR